MLAVFAAISPFFLLSEHAHVFGVLAGDTSPHIHRPPDTPSSIEAYLDYLALASRLATEVVLDQIGAAP